MLYVQTVRMVEDAKVRNRVLRAMKEALPPKIREMVRSGMGRRVS